MGCDIHAHIEIKVNGEWHHYSHPRIDRNYYLFTRMAGVRSGHIEDVEPISVPRGLPKDITFTTHFDAKRWGGDGHSHSWLSCKELAALVQWYDELQSGKNWISRMYRELGYLFGGDWDFHQQPENYPKGLQDARIVFWFDN